MADLVTNGKTSLSAEEVIVRAVQFFSTAKWKATTQSSRTATFEGRPPIPWLMLLLTILGFLACIVPGIIMYIMVIRKMYRFMNLVVTANPIANGTEVSVSHPKYTEKMVTKFLAALPQLA
ncbi:MAG: hypothetical protein ABSE95_05890 [Thermodesulfobacteriota bacterium]|jgi:hypothetical protein